jgi:Protein of unknown function (DUF3485)
MNNPVHTVAALALIVGSGIVHGDWTNRWRTSPALAELACRLESVPTVLGDWTATSEAIPPKQLAMAGAVGQISRVYTDPTKGLTVSVLLLCGLPGNVSTHTPDVCYPGAGYLLGNSDRFVHRYGIPERAAEFQTSVARRAGTKPSSLRLFWAWHGSNGWSAPASPRWAFAAEPMLSKLYIVRETGGVEVDPEGDPCNQFLALLLPELDRVMSASGQATGAKPSGVLQ